jgi:hypothetical protein
MSPRPAPASADASPRVRTVDGRGAARARACCKEAGGTHFFLQVKGRPHTAHVLLGKSPFLTPRVIIKERDGSSVAHSLGLRTARVCESACIATTSEGHLQAREKQDRLCTHICALHVASQPAAAFAVADTTRRVRCAACRMRRFVETSHRPSHPPINYRST